ncbi:class D beta-lactamase [Xanthobacter dioxanivorans]|uniref:Beta-lactamase n=1 Tax=Xanthobacter dioxanivorans TaxID=2528964 RepID=A0A974PKD0_9HYPH|nr:penicillin-binding transpeptidase domain-containing protein [Xanthobacter dioxanivorans]QRG04801.1 class D beta-lactamase [Xanthobacter dioxanivorans]
MAKAAAVRAPGRAHLTVLLSLVAGAVLAAAPARAAEDCLLVTDLETGRVLAKQGLCATRHPPNSTFKVALALMGFDAGLLKSDSQPVIEPPPDADLSRPETRGPQTPRSWMQNSVVWYSQVLARQLGAERIAHYLKAFAYGSENIGGVKGDDEPLARFWISSSLRLSPREQIDFLRKMLKGELPVSADAVRETMRILALDAQPAGWLTFGKTGSGFGRTAEGAVDRGRPFGWFVGFAQKAGRTAVFVRYTALDIPSPEPLGLVAKRQTLAALVPVLGAQAP